MKRILSGIKAILIRLVSLECYIAKKWVGKAYKRLMWVEWSLPPNPENFDHDINIYYLWKKTGKSDWIERGIYNCNVLRSFDNPCKVVELCCGDGFYSKHFYATYSKTIYACDYDEAMLRYARRNNCADNIVYRTGDIRGGIIKTFPELSKGDVDCVIWDAGIDYFSMEDIHAIIKDIKDTLCSGTGVLCGCGVKQSKIQLSTENHKCEFKNMEDLGKLMKHYFNNVIILESPCDNRSLLHFFASDGILPFTDDNRYWLRK